MPDTQMKEEPTHRISSVLTKNKPFAIRSERANHNHTPHVVVMVGLPARGKTYMSKKLTRYLNWIGIKTRVFNVGEYRRKATELYKNHDFFRPDNEEAMKVREQCAYDALADVCKWIEEENGEIAVFDATNTTRDRRRFIYDIVVKEMEYKLFYIESICDDPKIIESNIKEVKVSSPDYKNAKADDAVSDFVQRIKHYESRYQPLDEALEDHLSFMKIYNAGEKIVVHRHDGNIQSRIVYYLMNIHITPRNIYFTRHGESECNLEGKIGGDSDLSERGEKYAEELAEFVKKQNIPNLHVWTSWKKRTIQTVKGIKAPHEMWKHLNEIDAGICEAMTYEEIKEKYPDHYAARDEDKFHYRYPRGESYEDLVARLEPVIMELERQENVMIVAHQAVLRCLLAYYLDEPSEKLPYIKVPLHTVIKLTPVAYGCALDYINLNVPCVETYRPKPEPTKETDEEEK